MFRVILASVLGFYIGTNFYISHMLARWLGLRGAGAAVWYGVFALVAGSYFLTFGSEGVPFTVLEEEAFIQQMQTSTASISARCC